MKKKIYFVRHGESVANATRVHSSGVTPLTDRGHAQAETIAERAMKLPIEIIVASTMTRAQETAQHIADKTGRVIKSSDLFTEGRNASEIIEKPAGDPEVARIQKIIDDNFYQNLPKYSDEEDFGEVKIRALKALAYLEEMPDENILVVTHGWFLAVLVSVAIYGKDVSPRECATFVERAHMENTGVTIIGYDNEKYSPWPWWMWVWNDHAHLG